MRFKRLTRYTFEDTARKRAALARKQRRERESLPLFAEAIAAEQPSADDVMQLRAERAERQQAQDREHRAAEWRRARARLASYPQPLRAQLRTYWQGCGWTADPSYLLSMLRMFDQGRLNDPDRWRVLVGCAPPTPAQP